MRIYSAPRPLIVIVSAAVITQLILEPIASVTLADMSWPKNNVRIISLMAVALWIVVAENGRTFERYSIQGSLQVLCDLSRVLKSSTPLALALFIALYLPHPVTWLICFMGYALHRITTTTQRSSSTRTGILDSMGFDSSQPGSYVHLRIGRPAFPALALVTLTALAFVLMRFGINRPFVTEMPLILAASLAAAQFSTKTQRNTAHS
jgi:hypothetical protein